MKINNGKMFWQDISKIQKTYPYLSYNAKADILIIGGGIVGAMTAYFLAKEGAKIIVVDKNIVGFLGTLATPATLEYETDMEFFKLEKMIGETQAKRIYSLCYDALNNIEKLDKKIGGKNRI